jgi:dTDP-4-dehydrorhamnose reductase
MPNDNREAMRIHIATHIAMDSCTQREAAIPSLACSSITSQSESQSNSASVEDASSRLQAYIMRQKAPVLAARPLKRLLDMHSIKYPEKSKLRHLRSHLYSCVDRLEHEKCASG